MNKVTNAIERMKLKIKEKNLSSEMMDKLNKQLDMELEEYVKFQELKNIAMMDNMLTLDETNTIYKYLGNTLEHFNNQPLEVKVVLTQILKELLDMRIKKMGVK